MDLLLNPWLFVGIAIVFCALTAVFFFLSYQKRLKKLEELFDRFLFREPDALDALSDTRESKLEHKLYGLLHRARQAEAAAAMERDQISSLISDLSHQLKTPLANVVMYAELLQDPSLTNEEQQEFAAQTQTQAKKMQWLMKDMLKAARLEQGSLSFSADFCSITETISLAVSGVHAQAADKKIALITEPFLDRPLYHNPRWTAEAMGNILDNAIKYSPEGSRILIRLCPLEIYTRIDIQDQGPGIPQEEHSDLFKRFYRGKNSGQTEGSGLGLYLAQLILNKEKGYLTVSSRPGDGSCFQIHLLNPVSNPEL